MYRAGCVGICLLVLGACYEGPDADPRVELAQQASCAFDAPIGTAGQRRLALIVGVGEYQNAAVSDLDGPPRDARRVYGLVTSEDGYGFPAENVCLLLDEEATTARFREAFERGLIERAAAGDEVLIFFAGHGSQTKDRNGDEPDEWDETLMLH